MASESPATDPARDNESKVGMIVAISVVFVVLSTLVTGLRVYTRAQILRNFKMDDWAICLAQVLSIFVTIMTCLEAHYALGRHVWTVDAEDIIKQLKTLYSVIITYNIGMNAVKVSFLLLYLRIFQGTIVRKVSIWVMAYVILWAVLQAIILGLACIPGSFVIPSLVDVCLDTYPVWLLSSIMSTVTDFAIFLIPLPCVVKLQLKRKKKIMTVLMFCLGFFTCVISIIRIFSLREAIESEDPTWFNTGAACWSVVELNCAILCACFPTLRPLLARIIPGWSQVDNQRSNTYGMYAYSRTGAARRPVAASFEDVKTVDIESGKTDSTEHLKSTVACYSSPKESRNGLSDRDEGPTAAADVPGGGKGKAQIFVTTETEIMMDSTKRSQRSSKEAM